MACNLSAVSDEASLAFAKQSACGTPSTALTAARYTSESMGLATESTESQEIRSDRNVIDTVRTSASVTGDVAFELSYGSHDPLFLGLLQASTTFDGAGTPVKNGKTKHYFKIGRAHV